jgi:hypothetical protein
MGWVARMGVSVSNEARDPLWSVVSFYMEDVRVSFF